MTAAAAKLCRVSRAAACERLGVSRATFWRKWHAVFTEVRDGGTAGRDRQVLSDELDVAVESGPAAVLLYRRQTRRR